MTKKANWARNVAIVLLFALLTTISAGASWVSTQARPLKAAARPAPLPLPPGVAIEAGERPGAHLRELTSRMAGAGLPAAPPSLAEAAARWAEGIAVSRAAVKARVTGAHGPYLAVSLEATAGDEAIAHQALLTDVEADRTWPAQSLVAGDLAPFVRRAAKAGDLPGAHPTPGQAAELAAEGAKSALFTPAGLRVPLPGAGASLALAYEVAPLTAAGALVAEAFAAEEEFVGLPAPRPRPGEVVELGAGPVDCREANCIALTFDDGPGPGTPRLLDLLGEEGVPATFFVVGRQVPEHPEIIERMVAEGHAVGNHTWRHPSLPELTRPQIRSQVRRATEAIEGAGAPSPVLFRPPYGARSTKVSEEIARLGYATILWDVDPLDWHAKDPKKVARRVVKEARPGSIILMHDIHDTSIEAVPAILKRLRSQGYTFVTVPDLLGGQVEIGRTYRHNR